MNRTVSYRGLLACLALPLLASCKPTAEATPPPFDVVESTIPAMRQALESGQITSRQLVSLFLDRIALNEDRLNAIITVNPRALQIADSLDRLRAEGHILGPLHGIPVALKDIILTKDITTTGGALAFRDLKPPYDATVTANLESAGAIIIAKAGLTELANWMASGMPGNYTGVAGYGYNPYDPRRDPRPGRDDGRPVLGTGGSSSGIGTSASFWAGNVGTETSGSILSPSNATMLVGIKPTVGRLSRWGIIPVTADQDTPGPMTRTVTDAAIMLGAMEGKQPDPHDTMTARCDPPPNNDYTAFLDANALQGARIGIPRDYFYDSIQVPGSKGYQGGLDGERRAMMEDAIQVLKAQGATVVDPAVIPSVLAKTREDNELAWGLCAGMDDARGKDDDCSIVLKYGMKRDFNDWVATLGNATSIKSLTDLRQWNLAHRNMGTLKYGQARLDISDQMDLQRDREHYLRDRARDIRLGGTEGIDAALKQNNLDALLFPGASGSGIAAKPGYPSVTVPYGMVPNTQGPPFPEGFDPKPGPMGVTFTASACSEPRLIALAYAFEQATKKRVPPPGLASGN